MGYGYRELNFINAGRTSSKIDFGLPGGKSLGLTGAFDAIEKMIVRIGVACLIGVIAYTGFTMTISKGLDDKTNEVNEAITKIDKEISKASYTDQEKHDANIAADKEIAHEPTGKQELKEDAEEETDEDDKDNKNDKDAGF